MCGDKRSTVGVGGWGGEGGCMGGGLWCKHELSCYHVLFLRCTVKTG
mgnify:CR=1 FL=1